MPARPTRTVFGSAARSRFHDCRRRRVDRRPARWSGHRPASDQRAGCEERGGRGDGDLGNLPRGLPESRGGQPRPPHPPHHTERHGSDFHGRKAQIRGRSRPRTSSRKSIPGFQSCWATCCAKPLLRAATRRRDVPSRIVRTPGGKLRLDLTISSVRPISLSHP